MSIFEKPSRKDTKLRIGIQGLAFSGKTYSALQIARGLVGEEGKIALLDCEGGEASLYQDVTEFSVFEMKPPFAPEKYIEVMNAAKDEGFDVLILDTISHEWAGEGGLLECHGELEKNSQGKMASYSAWADITPRHNAFFGAMVRCGIHIIATIRSKPQYVVDQVNGRNVPRKVGLGPVQRDMADYEFSVYFEMDDNHTGTVKKDRTGVLGGFGAVFEPSVETGKLFRDWLEGKEPKAKLIKEKEPEKKKKEVYSKEQVASIRLKYMQKGWNEWVFDVARMDGDFYDKAKIDADYKQRMDLESKMSQIHSNPKDCEGVQAVL